jgi:molybdenum cofactor cytidylyltransferase
MMKERSVSIVVLAAGKATRMGEGGSHKLLAEFDGTPLVRRVALAAGGAGASSVAVVVGHRQAEIRQALYGLPLLIVENPAYESGMASSLKVGFTSADVDDTDGVLVMMADMPAISAEHLDRLIVAFRDADALSIVRSVANGQPGNPVILPGTLKDAIRRLEGDKGARGIIETCGLPIIDVEFGDVARLDLDTPEAIVRAGGILKG